MMRRIMPMAKKFVYVRAWLALPRGQGWFFENCNIVLSSPDPNHYKSIEF